MPFIHKKNQYGALKKILLDFGNNENVVVNDNIGQLWDIKDL